MSLPKMLDPVKLSDESPGPLYAISRTEAKAHLRVEDTDEDDLIDALIIAAHEKLDGWNGDLGTALITQTWRISFDQFPGGRTFHLPFGPIQTVTLNYYDGDNADQTFTAFSVHEDDVSPFVYLDEAQDSWPATSIRPDAVRFTVEAGYGDNPDDVPQPIRQAMLLMIGHWHENREQSVVGLSVNELPLGVKALLQNYRRSRF